MDDYDLRIICDKLQVCAVSIDYRFVCLCIRRWTNDLKVLFYQAYTGVFLAHGRERCICRSEMGEYLFQSIMMFSGI